MRNAVLRAAARKARTAAPADAEPRGTAERAATARGGIALLSWDPVCQRSVSLARELGVELETIHFFWYRRPRIAPLKYVLQAMATLWWLRRRAADVVVVTSPPPFAAAVVWLYCAIAGGAFVIDAHTGVFLEPKWRWFLPLSRWLMRRAAFTVVTNEALRAQLADWRLPAFVLPDPLPSLRPPSAHFPLDRTCFNVAAVFSFYEDEPVDELLAVRELPADMRLYITGDSAGVGDRVRRQLPSQLSLTGFLPREQFEALLRDCDAVMVLCTRPHTLLCGAYEAVAAAKPLLTSHSDAMRAYFRGGTVFCGNSTAEIEAGLHQVYRRHSELAADMRKTADAMRVEWRETCDEFHAALSSAGARACQPAFAPLPGAAAAATGVRPRDGLEAREDARVLGVDAVVLIAIVLGFALRLLRLDAAPLWLDEVLTATWVQGSWGELVRAAMTDNHPPLYFALTKATVAIGGAADWSLRLPSAIASSAAVGLTAALAAALAGKTAARWAAVFAALSPFLVHHGQEARMYGLVAALGALQLLLLVRYLNGTGSRLGWGFAAASAALVATHYYAVILIAAELLACVALMMRGARVRGAMPGMIGAASAAALAVAAAALLARHEAGSAYGLGVAAAPGTLWALLAGYAVLPSSAALHAHGVSAALPYAPLAALGLVALLIGGVAGVRALSPALRVFVVTTITIALAAPLAAPLFAPIGMHPRYLAAVVPLFIAVLASGAPSRLSWNLRTASAVGLAAIMAIGTAAHLADPGHGREDVRGAGEWLDAHVPAGETVLVMSPEMEILARHHWPRHALRLYPDRKTIAGTDNAAELAERIPFSAAGRVIYVTGRTWLTDPSGALRKALEDRYARCPGATLRGIDVLCFRAPEPTT